MNILRADELHGLWRKTGVLQTCPCEETNRLLHKWANEEAAQKEQDTRWLEKSRGADD